MVSIILVSPKEPGNIGATARAMKNMGFDRLCLVSPRCDLDKAKPLASHAVDLLENVLVFDDLISVVADCELVASTTARVRSDHAVTLTPREAVKRFSTGKSAIVFGREESGLTNEELDLCNIHIKIPTSDIYQSLNLSQAVLIVCYEMFLANKKTIVADKQIAKRGELEGMYEHLLHYMLEVGYTDQPRKMHILRRFRQIFDRAELNPDEVKLVRGLLAQGLWAAKKKPSDEVVWPLGNDLKD